MKEETVSGQGGYDDMKKILNVVHNIAQNADQIPLFHLDGVEQ